MVAERAVVRMLLNSHDLDGVVTRLQHAKAAYSVQHVGGLSQYKWYPPVALK